MAPAPLPCSATGCGYTTPSDCTDNLVQLKLMKLHTQQTHTGQGNKGGTSGNPVCIICDKNYEIWKDECLNRYTALMLCLPCYKTK